MTGSSSSLSFQSYPQPKALEQPYQTPPPGKNPVLRGLPIHYLGSLVATLPPLQSYLWSNAGFGKLRTCAELNDTEPRFDPTVIPLPQPGDELPASYTRVEALRVSPTSPQPRFHTIADFHNAYSSGTVTPTQVIETLLPLILRDATPRTLHATSFTESRVDLVRRAAEASTQRWASGKPLGVLDGVPFAVKDDVDVKGYKRHVGTNFDYTEGREVETSWCVRKVEEEGAVLVGKLGMHELGSDTTGNNPIWGTPVNPYNKSFYPGGSSSGAASAVGFGLIPFAIGSDGGGSIRIPSNYCGLYGLKPSHGRVSIAPMHGAAKSVVVRGPLTSSMADLELSYRVLAQPDPSNIPSSLFSPPRPLAAPRQKILGVYRSWIDRSDPQVQESFNSTLHYFQSELSYQVVDISIPLLQQGQLAHALTILAEGSTVLKQSIYSFTPANRILQTVGRHTPARDFLLAQRLRNILMEHLSYLFKTHPGLIIVTPTTPNAGWRIEEGDLAYGLTNANYQLKNMEYVWLANFTGIPCIQFPMDYVEATQGGGKVPVGLSGNGEWGSEEALIQFGFDGEKWLHEGRVGGKPRPEEWVDILKKV